MYLQMKKRSHTRSASFTTLLMFDSCFPILKWSLFFWKHRGCIQTYCNQNVTFHESKWGDVRYHKFLSTFSPHEWNWIETERRKWNYQRIFKFNGGDPQLKHLKEVFTHIINNSKKGPNEFIDLVNFYSRCRPNQHNISRELIECIYSSFTEQIDEIQQYIKQFTYLLKIIMFPEEFPVDEDEQQKEMFLLL